MFVALVVFVVLVLVVTVVVDFMVIVVIVCRSCDFCSFCLLMVVAAGHLAPWLAGPLARSPSCLKAHRTLHGCACLRRVPTSGHSGGG